ncbi:MAG: translation initiation factor IF-3 [Alphaproteobacteria bacterium]
MSRDFSNTPPKKNDGPRINLEIKEKEVRLIDHNGENHGAVSIRMALDMAEAAGLDLIEISPNSNPVVCKILDYGKYRYEMQKKKSEAKKNQKIIEIKEIKIRPQIDVHDYEVKLKQAKKFLSQGDKVKFSIRFRGRENPQSGKELLDKVLEDLEGLYKMESPAKLDGRNMMMIVSSS